MPQQCGGTEIIMSENTASQKPIKRSTKLFISGVLVLTVANVLNKILGLCFKIPLEHYVGNEGMGYFNQAYTIYTWLYMVSTTGLPTAVSMMISESRAKGNTLETKRVYKVTMMLFVVIGLVGTTLMMAGAGVFSALTKSPKAETAIIFIGPTLFFICISSALRGYFQGYQVMVPTAISQLIESFCKFAIGIIFALWALDRGYEIHIVAAYAILGITIGAGLGMFYLLLSKWFFREEKYNEEYLVDGNVSQDVSPVKTILKRLVVIAIPITISASMLSMTDFIDLTILMRRLQDIGYTEEAANALYGNWKTCVVPLFNLPPVLIYPISYSLVPMIRATLTRGERDRAETFMNMSIRVCAILSIPCALGMSVMSKPILKLIFSEEGAEMGAPLLSILAPAVFFVCMLSISNALLQASGYERKPIISMLAGAVVKLVSTYVLVGIPSVGIYGTPIGTLLCYFTVTAFNTYFLIKYVKVKLDFKGMFLRPLTAGVICAASAFGSYKLFGMLISRFISDSSAYKLSTLIGILVAVVVYLVLIFKLKAITEDDLKTIPKGEKLLVIMKKIKLM